MILNSLYFTKETRGAPLAPFGSYLTDISSPMPTYPTTECGCLVPCFMSICKEHMSLLKNKQWDSLMKPTVTWPRMKEEYFTEESLCAPKISNGHHSETYVLYSIFLMHRAWDFYVPNNVTWLSPWNKKKSKQLRTQKSAQISKQNPEVLNGFTQSTYDFSLTQRNRFFWCNSNNS